MNVKATGSAQQMQQTRRVLLTRPVTATPSIGLTGDAATQAETVYECIRLIGAGHGTSEVSNMTGLDENFIDALQDRFWGD